MSETHATHDTEQPHQAGAFDIRNFIGLLIGIFGIVLVLLGIFNSSPRQLARADGLHLNLWSGIGMIVVAACFLAWARMKPVIVPARADHDGEPPSQN